MVNVDIQFEIQDHYGNTIADYWKSVEMPEAPQKGMGLEQDDVVWVIERTVQYSLEQKRYYVRLVEHPSDPTEWINLMTKLKGWEKTK